MLWAVDFRFALPRAKNWIIVRLENNEETFFF